jgi:ribosomal protein S18 acetylase RimI-like enzyme
VPAELLPGFLIRNATLDDIPVVAAVGRACDIADIGEVDTDENWLHDEWVRPRFDPSTDAWVVTERGGEVVAFAYTWDEEPHARFDSGGWVHPDHRGRGLGTALVREVERRALRDRAQVPAGSTLRVLQSFDADASGARDPDASRARMLFESLGYAPETEYLHMEIEVSKELAVGDAPAGIVVRSRTAADDRDIVAVMADAFDDPWDHEEARQEFLARKTHDPSLWLIALDGDVAVGALFGYLTNGRGQISALGVRDGWRRRGIAQALLRGAFVRFRDRGAPDVRLNVDRDNAFGASRLYERVGMRLRRRWVVVAKDLTEEADAS